MMTTRGWPASSEKRIPPVHRPHATVETLTPAQPHRLGESSKLANPHLKLYKMTTLVSCLSLCRFIFFYVRYFYPIRDHSPCPILGVKPGRDQGKKNFASFLVLNVLHCLVKFMASTSIWKVQRKGNWWLPLFKVDWYHVVYEREYTSANI